MSDICLEWEKNFLPNKGKKSLKKGIKSLGSNKWDFVTAQEIRWFLPGIWRLFTFHWNSWESPEPLVLWKQWLMEINFPTVQLRGGKAREGLVSRTGPDLHSSVCLPVFSLELKLTLVQRYTDSCLLSHSWAWKKLAAIPLVINSNNCWQYL